MRFNPREQHLQLLRALTRRMFAGSLLLKGWLAFLVAALLAVAHDPARARWAWLAVFISIVFWMLDAHLLRQQRLYQRAYQRARVASDAGMDFSLNTSALESEANAWRSLMFSRSVALFYGAVLAAIGLLRWVR